MRLDFIQWMALWPAEIENLHKLLVGERSVELIASIINCIEGHFGFNVLCTYIIVFLTMENLSTNHKKIQDYQVKFHQTRYILQAILL